jgi:ferritin
MLSPSIESAINLQLKHEIESAYLYLAMSAYCESVNLPGIATWLRIQWQEELSHGMKLFRYINDRRGRVTLDTVEKPPKDYASPIAVFTLVLEHERKVTAAINNLYDLAIRENDHATQIELQWFVQEQVEEEKNADEVLHMLRMVGESGLSLLMLDRQLGQRAAGK